MGESCCPYPAREQAAGHLRWEADYPPRNLWVRGSNLTGGHNRLSCPRSADTASKPYLTLPYLTGQLGFSLAALAGRYSKTFYQTIGCTSTSFSD